jgi:hypothetical protein
MNTPPTPSSAAEVVEHPANRQSASMVERSVFIIDPDQRFLCTDTSAQRGFRKDGHGQKEKSGQKPALSVRPIRLD